MRTSLVRGLAVLAGALGVVSIAGAAEPYANGLAVAREVAASDGSRFLMTVRPPADRGVDPRIFDVMEFNGGKQVSSKASQTREEAFAQSTAQKTVITTEDNDLVDVSGYKIEVQVVSLAVNCSGQFAAKFKKVNLNGQKTVEVSVFGASSMTVTAYPTKGDVDAYVFPGGGTEDCSHSIRAAGQLDFAACIVSSCSAATNGFDGDVHNPFSSQATFVASWAAVIAN
jgi:hypothetical protein